jgi:hypothetical protein
LRYPKRLYLTLSEINDFICLDYVENPNPFYSYYIGNLSLIELINSYLLFFNDTTYWNINESVILELLSDHIIKFFIIEDEHRHIILELSIKYIKIDSFWNKMINTEGICEAWNDDDWVLALENISSNDFWNKFIDSTDMYKNWNDEECVLALKNISSDYFWNKFINSTDMYKDWNDEKWVLALKNIRSDYFWDKFVDTTYIYLDWNNDLWLFALENIESDYFWDKIIDGGRLLFQNWSEENFKDTTNWHIAAQKIKSNDFWNKAIDNRLYNKWNKKVLEDSHHEDYSDYSRNFSSYDDSTSAKSVWYYLIVNIKSNEFWKKVVNSKVFETWSKYDLELFVKKFNNSEISIPVKKYLDFKDSNPYISFRSKYLKYKSKYLNLKNRIKK